MYKPISSYLGKLCKYGHEYEETGKSLRNIFGNCMECNRISSREHRKKYGEDFDQKRDRRYQRKYGITLEDFNEMYDQQNGLCAICGKPEIDGKFLSVDHDHQSGDIRGLLCSNCNKNLGVLENLDWIKKAAKYLDGE